MRTRRAFEQMSMGQRSNSDTLSNSTKLVRSKTDITDSKSSYEKKRLESIRKDYSNNNETNRPGSTDDDYSSTKSSENDKSKSHRTSNAPSPHNDNAKTNVKDNNGNDMKSDSGRNSRASITPTIKIDDYDRLSESPRREEDIKSSTPALANGKDKDKSTTSPTQTVGSTIILLRHFVVVPFSYSC